MREKKEEKRKEEKEEEKAARVCSHFEKDVFDSGIVNNEDD